MIDNIVLMIYVLGVVVAFYKMITIRNESNVVTILLMALMSLLSWVTVFALVAGKRMKDEENDEPTG